MGPRALSTITPAFGKGACGNAQPSTPMLVTAAAAKVAEKEITGPRSLRSGLLRQGYRAGLGGAR
jgi:hypothetical protein